MTEIIQDPDVPPRVPAPAVQQKTTAMKLDETELASRAMKLRFLQENRAAVERANLLTRFRAPGG